MLTFNVESPASVAANFQGMPGYQAAVDKLVANDWDMGVLRPWLGRDGRSYVTKMTYNQKTGKVEPKAFVWNAPATLTRDAYYTFDNTVVTAIREELRAVADVRSIPGLVYNLPNAMGHTVLQYQTQTDITPATISMDPIRRSESDRPMVDQAFLPLPIIHKDFDFSSRQIEVSRSGRVPMPLDNATADSAARRVAEAAEKLLIGDAVNGPWTAGSTLNIYGYINFPNRATATLTAPTGSNGQTVLNEVLALRQQLLDDGHTGPFAVYVNKQWAQYLDQRFSTTEPSAGTLRSVIEAIEDIRLIRTLNYLPSTKFHMLMIEMKATTVRMIVGIEPMLVQWESEGGFMKHFKVMAMLIPQLRPDTSGNSGVGHGQTL